MRYMLDSEILPIPRRDRRRERPPVLIPVLVPILTPEAQHRRRQAQLARRFLGFGGRRAAQRARARRRRGRGVVDSWEWRKDEVLSRRGGRRAGAGARTVGIPVLRPRACAERARRPVRAREPKSRRCLRLRVRRQRWRVPLCAHTAPVRRRCPRVLVSAIHAHAHAYPRTSSLVHGRSLARRERVCVRC